MRHKTLVFTGTLAWLGGLATAFALPSCEPMPAECAPDHREHASVVVKFVDGDGDPISGDMVAYTIREMELKRPPKAATLAECIDEQCTQWVIGRDEPGVFNIQATACGKPFIGVAEVEMDEFGCHVVTQTVEFVVEDACEQDLEPPPRPETVRAPCDKMAHPSVHVFVVDQQQDVLQHIDVDQVWWSTPGAERQDARCIHDATGKCAGWLAGFEVTGEIEVGTTWCEREVSDKAFVELDPQGCHVQTEYMLLEVETNGCLTNEPPLPIPPDSFPVNPRFKNPEEPDDPGTPPMSGDPT